MKRILILLYCVCPLLLYGQNVLFTLEDMHTVVKGETWESIASQQGITVMELKAANPDVKKKKLKKGTLLILPQRQEPVPVAEVPEKPVPVIRTAYSNVRVGVLLPLADRRMVEFYRGLLMAADSVRKSGVNLDIHAWDCGTTIAQIEALLPKLKELDVLFGPASATQIPPVAEVCKEQGIRLVLPFFSGQILQDYPLVYNVTAPSTLLYVAAMNKLRSFYPDRNYVVVRTGNTDNKGKNLVETVTQSLAQQASAPRTLELEGDDFAYESAFNQFRDNMIVLDDSNIRSLNILLSHIKDFRLKHPQYRLSVLGFDSWLDETATLLDDFFTLDTYIISPYYYNVLDDRIKAFERNYTKNFRASVSMKNPRFAALGFDLGQYFLQGISSLGDTFEQMQGSIHQKPYQNFFSFERNASAVSFVNNFVQFIHYTPENKIEIIR